ncbi:MAG TPA: hypothetical protein VMU24_14065, partial [Candidatus Acidoferrales bacterium]|nr:hypothetical protein [Candidatus Acidoferrales bacterium]
ELDFGFMVSAKQLDAPESWDIPSPNSDKHLAFKQRLVRISIVLRRPSMPDPGNHPNTPHVPGSVNHPAWRQCTSNM